MLTQLELIHFKCFEKISLPLSALSVLTGGNSAGKSSVFQSLVLLHQTMKEYEWSPRLLLNGKSIELGTVADVVDKVTSTRYMGIHLASELGYVKWTFEGERSDMSMNVNVVDLEDDPIGNPDNLHRLMPLEAGTLPNGQHIQERLVGLSYITAERVGPRNTYELQDLQTASSVGPRGEYAASILHNRRSETVMDGLVLDKAPPTLLRQVEAWMEHLFPGCEIDLQQVAKIDAVFLGLRSSADTDFHRPVHVGFGILQVFPIIVAILAAKQGDVVLIENPEVHLHPSGQALMGQFLAKAAAAGVQVLIETHSDHVLNGIRRAVKMEKLDPEKIAIHYFAKRGGEVAQVSSPRMDRTGKLDFWPEGFFDQFDKDATFFANWE